MLHAFRADIRKDWPPDGRTCWQRHGARSSLGAPLAGRPLAALILHVAFQLILVLAVFAARQAHGQSSSSPAAAPALAGSVLSLQATYGGDGPPIEDRIVWRIYALSGSEPSLVTKSEDRAPSFVLPPGEYIVHAAVGLAGVTRQISLGARNSLERIAINVGGLSVIGQLGGPDRKLASDRQAIAVYVPIRNNSEGRLLTDRLRAGEVLRLPEGTYHVVSTYIGSNSIVRGDVRVSTGKVVEVIMTHRAATMTLKLVRAAGGTALANTSWTVETPGGDIIREALGAFPTMELAEGAYTVVARHNGKEYRGEMRVLSGADRDFEVIMKE